MELSYRRMRTSDVHAVFAVRLSTIQNAVTMEELERVYSVTPQSVSDAMKSHVKGWLCEDSGTVVGFAMGNVSTGEVLVVAVLPEYEGYGIGRDLLMRVQTWLFFEGHEEIWLLANPDPSVRAHGFYRKLGWQATGTLRDDNEVMKLRRNEAQPTPEAHTGATD